VDKTSWLPFALLSSHSVFILGSSPIPFSFFATLCVSLHDYIFTMPFTAKERQKVEKLRRRYRIDFLGEVPRHEWPESHRSTFNAVEELGRKQFDTYAVDLTTVETAPWSADVKKQAEDLTERAKRCVRRNESTWRFACEPYALARLTSEVVW
jgi:hypothetical protein